MPTKHTATDSRGTVHKRTSQEREYSHAIVAHLPAYPASESWPHVTPARDVVSWASRLDLAHKEARKWAARPGLEVEIVEAVRVTTPLKVRGA